MVAKQNTILIVEDTLSMAILYERQLKLEGYRSDVCHDGVEALGLIQSGAYQTVLLDLDLPGKSGLDILKAVNAKESAITFIVITANGSVNSAVDAMRLGAYDFLIKPFPHERMVACVQSAQDRAKLKNAVNLLQSRTGNEPAPGFIGSSEAMQIVYANIESVAHSKAPVFVTGESGTGKEVTAHAIHKLGPRANGPFIAINCAAIPDNLMESEIFGHIKGAFTGAHEARKGAASAAHGGTLFLDEICEMDIGLQAKLLRFLQTGQIKRVGSDWTEDVDVRIVCATNRDPALEVAHKRFREDLYYRLNVLAISLPPLRARDSDAVELAEMFLNNYGNEEGKAFIGLSDDAKAAVRAYTWPGNIRELQNTIRKAVVMSDGDVMTAEMLALNAVLHKARVSPIPVTQLGAKCGADIVTHMPLYPVSEDAPLRAMAPRAPSVGVGEVIVGIEQGYNDIERQIIEAAIGHCNGSIPKASKMLKLSPSTIYRKRENWAADHANMENMDVMVA